MCVCVCARCPLVRGHVSSISSPASLWGLPFPLSLLSFPLPSGSPSFPPLTFLHQPSVLCTPLPDLSDPFLLSFQSQRLGRGGGALSLHCLDSEG